jgi:hypothetical protein
LPIGSKRRAVRPSRSRKEMLLNFPQGRATVASDPREALIEEIGSYALDPLDFVMFAFPWGEPGIPLTDAAGPRQWQRELLKLNSAGDCTRAIRSAD